MRAGFAFFKRLKPGQPQGYPTDAGRELAMGRIPVWLDAKDVRWLTRRCVCGDDRLASGHHTTERLRIRWRADVALHKAGRKEKQTPPGEV